MRYVVLTIFLLVVVLLMWILRDGMPRGNNNRGPIVEQSYLVVPSVAVNEG